jgi:hypothetical protein
MNTLHLEIKPGDQIAVAHSDRSAGGGNKTWLADTVARVTKTQIDTERGLKFSRRDGYEVGRRTDAWARFNLSARFEMWDDAVHPGLVQSSRLKLARMKVLNSLMNLEDSLTEEDIKVLSAVVSAHRSAEKDKGSNVDTSKSPDETPSVRRVPRP